MRQTEKRRWTGKWLSDVFLKEMDGGWGVMLLVICDNDQRCPHLHHAMPPIGARGLERHNYAKYGVNKRWRRKTSVLTNVWMVRINKSFLLLWLRMPIAINKREVKRCRLEVTCLRCLRHNGVDWVPYLCLHITNIALYISDPVRIQCCGVVCNSCFSYVTGKWLAGLS